VQKRDGNPLRDGLTGSLLVEQGLGHMMEVFRRILVAAVLVALPVMSVATAAAATTPSAEQQQLKKKKAAEAKKAAELKKKMAAEAKKAKAKKQAQKECKGFFQCMRRGKPRSGVQRASTGRAARDVATGEDISWANADKYSPGTIVISTAERLLYLVTGPGEARRYKVAVGREGFQWSGSSTIVGKMEWPDWRPPPAMIKREAAKGNILKPFVEGGPGNPLGARALYIGGGVYRIHGTNAPGSIGGAVSSGCIRMMNTDVVELYEKVRVGARVVVYR